MPESGTFGSVRGVPGNEHSYRDTDQATPLDYNWNFQTLERRRWHGRLPPADRCSD
jgi:hypothetical protein